MGLQQNKNEQISVGHFCGKHAMGAKKWKCSNYFLWVCVFFVAIYENEVISVGGHKKKHRPETVTPFEALYKTCL